MEIIINGPGEVLVCFIDPQGKTLVQEADFRVRLDIRATAGEPFCGNRQRPCRGLPRTHEPWSQAARDLRRLGADYVHNGALQGDRLQRGRASGCRRRSSGAFADGVWSHADATPAGAPAAWLACSG
jgi:hypothetical protein